MKKIPCFRHFKLLVLLFLAEIAGIIYACHVSFKTTNCCSMCILFISTNNLCEIPSSCLSFCLLTGDISLHRSLACLWRKDPPSLLQTCSHGDQRRGLMQPHGSKKPPFTFLLGRCHHECCSCSTDLPSVGVRPSS